MSVIFDQLRISDDGNKLYINAHVNTADYFDNAYLDCITIKTSDYISETNPKDYSHNYIYRKNFEAGTEKEVNLVLTKADFDAAYSNYNSEEELIINENKPHATISFDGTLSNTLLFVYVKIDENISPCTPCILDEPVTVGVTFNTKLLYQNMMGYTKELANTCEIPKGFTDYILTYNAFKAAVDTGHYGPAIDFWKQLFGDSSNTTYGTKKGCGCHG